MQLEHPKEQQSSLGISKVLEQEARLFEERNKRDSFTDATFKKVPSQGASLWTWTRFVVSLYYNKLTVNMFGFITGWHWYNRIDDTIILGALPTPSQMKRLHQKERVQVVVNLCQEFPGYEKIYKELKIEQIRLETPDFCVPTLDAIERGIKKILEVKEKGNVSIYLHCKAGKGRSAAIALCYLLTIYELDLIQAQKELLKKRPQVDKDLYANEEIRLFYKNLLAKL
ncbi:hypothetical protein G6F57_005928 [Rhizopus arrhizus]|nr:hypothetical protein G6F57_005928 [Rhizopus arrhizus]